MMLPIDQRGDFYSAVGEAKYIEPYVKQLRSEMDCCSVAKHCRCGQAWRRHTSRYTSDRCFGIAYLATVTLHSARDSCAGSDCGLVVIVMTRLNATPGTATDNIQARNWYWFGLDDGTNPDLDVQWGPNTIGSDLLYHTQTVREAFAVYTQGVWQMNDKGCAHCGCSLCRER